MTDGIASPYSISVAQKIVRDYFQAIMGNRSDVIMFYCHDAVLHWDGTDYIGLGEIQAFFDQLEKQVTFQIVGFDVQTIPDTDIYTMLVVYGSYLVPGARMQDFHSTFYIECRTSDGTAVIKTHCFTCY